MQRGSLVSARSFRYNAHEVNCGAAAMRIRPHYWTQEEYLVFEHADNSKHEHYDGQIYDMTCSRSIDSPLSAIYANILFAESE
ncbi:MAG: hypothetical protein CUN51_02505 [Candidatus Thermofonsia Clade 1 bacterium]|uniref:Uncharacterized protein n=1 Tax=Candidatus Thermofonsia Clade 1 bacterium TaxID=2364210 RepID=A0A2M8P2Q6_9CHLR|nr:MAG: hypothetical protein CUN51_02505 [Candidatus Thermofonsia Clade 1 bacterium]